MKNYISILFLTITLFSYGQEEIDSSAVLYEKTINTADLKKHLKVLTSKEFSGRETGTEGNRLAADYLQRQFREMGIPPLPNGRYFQNFPLIQQKQDKISFLIDNDSLSWMDDYFLSGNLYENKKINASLIYLNSELVTPDDETSYRGLIPILFRSADDKANNWQGKLNVLKEQGAEALVIIMEEYERNAERAKRGLSHEILKLAEESAYEKVPVIIMNPSFAESILGMKPDKMEKKMKKEELTSKQLTNKASIDINRETNILSSQNVLGYIEGNELKEEVVIVTAHFDHLGEKDGAIYYGADDDGSGTVALLELAEAFMEAKENGVKFKRSILFMPVSGEEKGLLGSRYYANNPVFPLENTIADLNIDMIGRYDEKHQAGSPYIYLIGSDKISRDLHDLSERTNEACCKLELDYTFNDENDPNRYYYRSDHYNFAKKGVPVIFYFSGVHEDYHKPTDTMDKIDFEMLQKRAVLVFHTAWNLLMAESRPAVNE